MNALRILESVADLRAKKAVDLLTGDDGDGGVRPQINAGVADWLSGPFAQTALSILKSMSGSNYKVREALRLLQEAGADAEKEAKSKKPKRKK